jgi:hypothetical protein
LLKNYTDSLARFLQMKKAKKRSSMILKAALASFSRKDLKKGATCITDDDVNAIIKSMGRPEEFDNGRMHKMQQLQPVRQQTSFSSSTTPATNDYTVMKMIK